LEHYELTKDVIVFKNAIKDPNKWMALVEYSKTFKDPILGEWQPWWGVGKKLVLEPNDDAAYNSQTLGGEMVRTFSDVFWDCFRIYKDQYINMDYIKSVSPIHTNLPTSREEGIDSGWNSADILVIDYNYQPGHGGFVNGYHVDKMPWWGSTPHAFTLNYYINDNYDGGGLYFVNLETAEIKTIQNGPDLIEYYEIDPPVYYKPESGDALLFRADVYHGVEEVTNGNKYFVRCFMTPSPSEEYIATRDSMSRQEFKDLLEAKRKEGLESKPHEMQIFDSADAMLPQKGQKMAVIRKIK
jgi:hypothetical protein